MLIVCYWEWHLINPLEIGGSYDKLKTIIQVHIFTAQECANVFERISTTLEGVVGTEPTITLNTCQINVKYCSYTIESYSKYIIYFGLE